MSELAEAARSSRSRLSHAVARLEERGWVRRLNCPTDRRGQLAQLTDEGFAVVEAAAPGHVEAVREVPHRPAQSGAAQGDGRDRRGAAGQHQRERPAAPTRLKGRGSPRRDTIAEYRSISGLA